MLKNQKDKFKTDAKQTLRDSVTYLADTADDAIPCLAPEVSCFHLEAAMAELAFILAYPFHIHLPVCL